MIMELKFVISKNGLLYSVCVSAKLLPWCLTLCDTMDCSPPGSSVLGILQARILEWVGCHALPQGIFLTQGLNPHFLMHWHAGSLPPMPPRKPHYTLRKPLFTKDTCTPMFNAELFTIARTWRQPICPSIDEWIKKL